MSRNIWNINLQILRMSPAGWHIFLGVMRKNFRKMDKLIDVENGDITISDEDRFLQIYHNTEELEALYHLDYKDAILFAKTILQMCEGQKKDVCDCQMSGSCRYEVIMHNKQHECRHKV